MTTRNIVNAETIEQRAARLFPENERMQELWIGAVCLVRMSKRGWILDQQVERIA